MSRRLLPLIAITATFLAACPAPDVVDDGDLPSGEETAQAADEAAQEPRGVLYETSRPDDEEPLPVDDVEEPDEPDEIQPELPTITLYLDAQGRFTTEDGEEIDIDELEELSDEPLQGHLIQIVADPDASDALHESITPLILAASDLGAYVAVTVEDDTAAQEEELQDPDESDEVDDDEDDQ